MTRLWPTAVVVGAVLALALPARSSASCIPLTVKQQERRADVIFVGVAREGPTATGIQRFRVVRYVKGAGPETAAVATGVVARADGSGSTTSVSVNVNAGERWQIYATRRTASDVLETSECDGSRKLASWGGGGGTPTPDARAGTAAAGEDHSRGLLVAMGLGALVVFPVALGVRRRLKRRPSSAG